MAQCFEKIGALYDLIYQDKDYVGEAAYIHNLICEFNQKTTDSPVSLLDLASGSARHAVELSKMGYKVSVSEPSESMRYLATQNCARTDTHLTQYPYTYQNSHLIPGSFDVIVSLFASLGYLTKKEEIKTTLENIHEKLKPGGVFIFDFWNTSAVLKHYSPSKILRKSNDTMSIIRLSETSLAPCQSTAIVDYTLIELNNSGNWTSSNESHKIRYFMIQEMADLVSSQGFILLHTCPFGESKRECNSDDWNITFVCKKSG